MLPDTPTCATDILPLLAQLVNIAVKNNTGSHRFNITAFILPDLRFTDNGHFRCDAIMTGYRGTGKKRGS